MATTQPATPSPRVFALKDADIHAMAAARARQVAETKAGATTHFVVFYANSLGARGPTLAAAVLARCESDYASLKTWFGGIDPAGLPFQIHIQPGQNGASHATCLDTNLHCDAFTGADRDLLSNLVVAEADEVFMAAQGAGWDCGGSNGEGLARVLAAELYPAQLTPPGLGFTFASANEWLNSNRPDFVTVTEPTDRNFVSIGCSTLFINYLRTHLGYSLADVVQKGAPTLAQTYTNLIGKTDAFAPFKAILDTAFPPGTQANLPNDNPFPLPPA